jgi:hypothetical protein
MNFHGFVLVRLHQTASVSSVNKFVFDENQPIWFFWSIYSCLAGFAVEKVQASRALRLEGSNFPKRGPRNDDPSTGCCRGENRLNSQFFDMLLTHMGGLLIVVMHFAILRGLLGRKVKQVSATLLNMSQLDPSWRQESLEFGIRDAALRILRGFWSGDLAQIHHFLHPELASQWQIDVDERTSRQALMSSVEIKFNDLRIVDVYKSAATDGDHLTVCLSAVCRGIDSSGVSVGAYRERFWTFRRIQGRWLLWRESEYSPWQRFINASVVNAVSPNTAGNPQHAGTHEASSVKRGSKLFLFFAALILAISISSSVSAFMSGFVRHERTLDTAGLVLPLGLFFYLLVRRSVLRILEQNDAQKPLYMLSVYLVGILCFQIALTSVSYLSLKDEISAKIAMHARVVDKDTQGAAVAWNPPPPQRIGNERKITKWPDGSIKSVEPVHSGKVHGVAVLTFPSGQLYGKIPFINGKKHGRFELFREDGSRDQILSYKDGRLHGMCEWFNADGSLKTKALYVEGELVESK